VITTTTTTTNIDIFTAITTTATLSGIINTRICFRASLEKLAAYYLGGKPPYFCENRHGLL